MRWQLVLLVLCTVALQSAYGQNGRKPAAGGRYQLYVRGRQAAEMPDVRGSMFWMHKNKYQTPAPTGTATVPPPPKTPPPPPKTPPPPPPKTPPPPPPPPPPFRNQRVNRRNRFAAPQQGVKKMRRDNRSKLLEDSQQTVRFQQRRALGFNGQQRQMQMRRRRRLKKVGPTPEKKQ
uniref:Uncharacterized protein n=1 Tax=Musca domestica TaxID=7370 RepID=A0A1I8NIS1_MUSDO